MGRPSCVISGPLQVKRIAAGKRILLLDLVVEITGRYGTHKITVPRDFETDYSSIPTCLHFVVRWSKVDIAGVVHDRLYSTGEISRRKADWAWFLVAISGDHCANWFQALLCWLALRGFGVKAWNDHAKENDAETEKTPLWTVIPCGAAFFYALDLLCTVLWGLHHNLSWELIGTILRWLIPECDCP